MGSALQMETQLEVKGKNDKELLMQTNNSKHLEIVFKLKFLQVYKYYRKPKERQKSGKTEVAWEEIIKEMGL